MADSVYDRPRMSHLGKLAKDVETFKLVRTGADELAIREKLNAAMQLLDEAAMMCGAMDRIAQREQAHTYAEVAV